MPGTPAPPERRTLSGRRAIQAEQTRAEILAAARTQFTSKGYAGTSVRDIASAAGVSVQTVYDSVGSKAELVRRLNDLIDAEAGIGELISGTFGSTDPADFVRLPARITRRLVERCGDIVRAASSGAQSDPELMPIVVEGGRRHRAGAAVVADRLAQLGALRADLSPADAANSIAAIADFRVAMLLLDEHGMSFQAIEDWMADTISRVVLPITPGD